MGRKALALIHLMSREKVTCDTRTRKLKFDIRNLDEHCLICFKIVYCRKEDLKKKT